MAHEIIDSVKESGLVFAYYPDPKWLASSESSAMLRQSRRAGSPNRLTAWLIDVTRQRKLIDVH